MTSKKPLDSFVVWNDRCISIFYVLRLGKYFGTISALRIVGNCEWGTSMQDIVDYAQKASKSLGF